MRIFLPNNYPSSVRGEYLFYSLFNFLEIIAVSILETISTQNILYALGLSGDGELTPVITINYVIKDCLGQLFGAILMSLAGEQTDSNPYRVLVISNIIMAISGILAVISPLSPKFFLLTATLSTILVNISWIGVSASRAKINLYLCLDNNIGDITSKSGLQNTLASVIGMTITIGISLSIGVIFWKNLVVVIVSGIFTILFSIISISRMGREDDGYRIDIV